MAEETAEERIAAVMAQAPDVETGERLATISQWGSVGAGFALSAKGGWVGVAAYSAAVGSGYFGSWLATTIHLGDGIAFLLDKAGMHRIGQGGPHPATVGHQVAHSYAFAGFLAAVAVGVATALVVGAVLASGGTALVIIGAAAAGGFAAGFVGGGLSDALSQMGYRTGPIASGSRNVFIKGRPVARMTDVAGCSEESSPVPLIEGSETIYVNGLPMSRIGHKLMCGATVDEGVDSVTIDETTIACAQPEPEVPVWARIAVDLLGFLPLGRMFGRSGRNPLSSQQPRPRLPQDEQVNPAPPRQKATNRSIGGNAQQQAQLSTDIINAQAQGASDVRVNQQQVNGANTRVGINRPDLQYTVNGQRYYVEYDTPSSGRGQTHADRILANDPEGIVILKTIPSNGTPDRIIRGPQAH